MATNGVRKGATGWLASGDAVPQQTVLACVPALFVALTLLVSGHMGLDAFCRTAVLCVFAGFLLVNPLITSITSVLAMANVVLRAGGDLTRMLAFLLVAHTGMRNPMGALGVALYVSGAEALELLACGRNTAAIQERMVVSRSTAKTHVRNVYAKLGVHSQQDLIDAVEAAAHEPCEPEVSDSRP